ncbi:hypothetical protein B0A55_02440 [Friedmanniomyces simplex]|uniref:Uncharacterized protein n=1 Tax=Friedmanniomyces simplex TaxID=329884 RepID=A0A4U0XPX1_9PEZI|nr:hypothetical protein B0A55_02440 [Friedmanniomyces simplex]
MSPVTAPPSPLPLPPADLTGVPALPGNGFENLHLAFTGNSPPTPPSPSKLNTQFLLSFGEPPHPELDKSIADGDGARVLADLARVSNQYPQPDVTFNTALRRAIECEQLGIERLCTCRFGDKKNQKVYN